MEPRIVRIVWNDAHDAYENEWTHVDDVVETGMVVTTVGILAKKTAQYYIVTSTMTQDGHIRGAICIPKTTVLSIDDLYM